MDLIQQKRIVPVAVLESVDEGLKVAEILVGAGLPIIEVTLRTATAIDIIAVIRKQYPAMLVGAGTILTPAQVDKAVDAGAQFGVAPGCTDAVIVRANTHKLPFVPGVMTPTDVERGITHGCLLQKFFPAENAGGIGMLKALSGPYKSAGVRFIPLGGVNQNNAKAYLDLPIVAAIGGSWIIERQLITEGKWNEIAARTTQALSLVTQK